MGGQHVGTLCGYSEGEVCGYIMCVKMSRYIMWVQCVGESLAYGYIMWMQCVGDSEMFWYIMLVRFCEYIMWVQCVGTLCWYSA